MMATKFLGHEWVELENYGNSSSLKGDEDLVIVCAHSPTHTISRFYAALCEVRMDVDNHHRIVRSLVKRSDLTKFAFNGMQWTEKTK